MVKRALSSFSSHIHIKGGAYTDIRELIRLRYAAKEIDGLTAIKTRNPLSGLLASHIHGRGIDFAEVRVYQPGDDVRSIDWRVTARTGTPHTKLFREEKERPVLILIDQSQAMFFGSRVAFKSVLAAEVAAVLAWTALERGDRIGGIVFSDSRHREVRPRRNKHAVLRLLNEVNDFNHALRRETVPVATTNYFAEALGNVRRVAKHGSTIFVISDFHDLHEEALVHFDLLARHHDLIGLHISDALERELPRPDLYTITDGTKRARINTADRHHRQQYHDTFSTRLNQVRSHFARAKSPLLELQTHEPVVESVVNRYNAYVSVAR